MGKIIELTTFYSEMEAEIAMGILRGAGIDCEMTGDKLSNIIVPLFSTGQPMIKILIDEDNYELATQLLDNIMVDEE